MLRIPDRFNAAHDLLERNLRAGRASKIAYIDDLGSYTYGDLAARVDRFANAIADSGMHMEQRILLCLQDGIDFPTAFLGAIKAGIVPVAVNTMLSPADYAYMLEDSRAPMLVVSESLLPKFERGNLPFLKHVLVSGTARPPPGMRALSEVLAASGDSFEPAPTCRDEPCFWLYSSGSTGVPKGTVHVHSSLIETAALYAQGTLGLAENDVMLSAAKLFFAYGLGNSLTFPLAVGGDGGIDGRAHHTGVDHRAPANASSHGVFGRSDAVCLPARERSAADGRGIISANVQFGGRGAAGGHRAALARTYRRGYRGWDRFDRDAAYFHIQST